MYGECGLVHIFVTTISLSRHVSRCDARMPTTFRYSWPEVSGPDGDDFIPLIRKVARVKVA
jgi:hypothetical protein